MSGLALITGAAGFVGRHLTEQLLEAGWKVRALDLSPSPTQFEGRVEWVQGSVLDEQTLRAAMSGVEHCYHLAALTHLWTRDRALYEQVNFHGVKHVLDAAQNAGVGHILITSTEVILRGWKDRRSAPLTEADPLPHAAQTAGPYCRSKLKGEQLARTAAQQGQPVSICYPTVPIGPGDYAMTAPSAMIATFLSKPPPAFMECVLNLVPVEDVARAMILMMKRPPAGRYILGGDNLSMATLLQKLSVLTDKKMPARKVPPTLALLTAYVSEIMAAVSKNPPLATLEGVRLARHPTYISSQKAKDNLSWEAGDIDSALERAALWMEREGFLSRSSHAPR